MEISQKDTVSAVSVELPEKYNKFENLLDFSQKHFWDWFNVKAQLIFKVKLLSSPYLQVL